MKITKWKALTEDSNIGLVLFITTIVAILATVLAPTTIGMKYGGDYENSLIANWDNPGYGLTIAGMVMTGVAFLAISAGWYFDPTKLDERISVSIAAGTMLIGMILAIAGVSEAAVKENILGSYDKGYLAGNLIMIIIPDLAALLLMVEPLMLAFKPKAEATK